MILGKLKRRLLSFVVPRFLSYDSDALLACLRALGVEPGDALMVHSSWDAHSGFEGTPYELIGVLKRAVGSVGLLAMPTWPYAGSSREYLENGEPMDLRRTPSRMGLVTEVFRRGRDVLRSRNPTHPVAAWGARAEWFLEGHEDALVPFGPGSPFEKLLEMGGKVLCINVGFAASTFTHFLEDRISDELSFPLYDPEPLVGRVGDSDGSVMEVPVLVLSDASRKYRREERLVRRLGREGVLRNRRIGNTRLLLMDCREMTRCVDEMVSEQRLFFDDPG